MFKHLLLLLVLIKCFSLSGQAIEIKAIPTSVEKVMALETPTAEEIDTILAVCLKYIFTNTDTCLMLAEHALSLSKSGYPGEAIHAKSLLFLGDAHRIRSEWEEAEEVLLMGKAMYQKLGNESRMASADLKLGAVNIRVERYEQALEYEFSALATFERLKDSANIYRPWFEISEIFSILNQPQKSLEYNRKIIAWGEDNDLPVMMMRGLHNRGAIQNELAQSFSFAADTTAGDPSAYRDSVRHYKLLSLESFTRAIPSFRKYGGKRGLAELFSNIMTIKVDLGMYDEALVLAEEVNDLSEQLNDPVLALATTVNLADIYYHTGRYDQAILEAEKGLSNPVAEKNALRLDNLHQQLYQAHKSVGNFQQALKYHELSTDFKEKNEAVERNKVISTVEAKYQSARKEKQILELNVANAAIKRKSNLYMLGAALLTMFGFLGFQLSRIRRERNQRAAFTEALIDAQEDERKRIARDLHDGIGQSLLVIKQQLGVNQNTTQENQQLIANTLEEVRTISRDLHPVLLEKFGITTTIKDTVERIAATAPELFISTEIDDIDGLLFPKTEVQIFRTVQEALSNVVKHAEASAAKVTVRKQAGQIEVLIQDNGKSFDYELAVARSKSMGLRTMFERITSAGGKFTIKSKSGAGTEITATVPIRQLH